MAYLSTFSRVIYASRWVDPERQDIGALLDDILASSTHNNLISGVTGLLLYREGWFLQALEGDLDAVDHVFDRIRRDGRHFDVRVVADEATFDRVFADWSMCASHIADIPAVVLGQLGLAGTFDPARLDPERALALLLAAAEARRDQARAA